MNATATLKLQAPDATTARAWQAALAPDDPDAVTIEVHGDVLHVTAQSASRMGLLRTMDDVLACLRGAGVD